MYIYKSFLVYFHLSSETGPYVFFFFCIGDFLYLTCFFGFFFSFLNYYVSGEAVGILIFMYVLSIKVPIRKKSVNLFNDPRIL